MKINIGGHWKASRPSVKVGTTWKPTITGWVNVSNQWRKFYISEYNHTISANQTNFNLFNTIGIPDDNVINVYVNPGVTIQASTTGRPAFDMGNSYVGKTINLINQGTIIGQNGAGGAGGSSLGGNGGAGGAGGTALYVPTANKINLTNQGAILGGSGGGGGGGGSHLSGTLRDSQNRSTAIDQRAAGGQGGSGININGVKGQIVGDATRGVSTRAAWGGRSGAQGAAGALSPVGYIDWQPNTSYTWLSPPQVKEGARGPGGRGGYAIHGISNVNLVHQGTITGSQV